MRKLSLRLSMLVGFLVLAVVVTGMQVGSVPSVVQAQDGDQCAALVAQALSTAEAACPDLAPGEICYAHSDVTVTVNIGDIGLATIGDRASLDALESLATSSVDLVAGDWGIVKALLPAGMADGEAVTAVLFGDVQISRPLAAASDRPTLTVWNSGTSDANLRNGAGVGYDAVGVLAPGQEVVADGRNQQADWVRIRVDDGVAWVFAPLLGWDGDLQTLEVLLPNDVTLPVQAGEPFQSFMLTTAGVDAVCSEAPSGLMLQHAGDEIASLIINDVTLEFADATLLVSAGANAQLDIKALAGAAVVTARGISEEITAGGAAQVNLGGDSGLTPLAPPTTVPSFAFAEMAHAPLSLLPGTMACVVGLSDSTANVQLRVGPGQQRGELALMNANLSYPVIGWANDPDGSPWWELDTGSQPAWVDQSQVSAIGACDTVAQVDPPPLVLAPAGGSDAGGGAPASGPDLAPTANSVWQMQPGSDQMSGECSGAPAINFCDHLAAIAPANGGISWKGMEVSPYILSQVQSNVYSYSGPNVAGTGTVDMTLTFSSATELNMTMTLTLNSEPNCQHTYFYTGTRQW